MNAAEWIFSAFLSTAIVSFGAGYFFGKAHQLYKGRPPSEIDRYRYDREGDTSQCK